MSAVLTRRSALRGSAVAALALAGGVAPALGASSPDAALIVQADDFRKLCARERQAWNDLNDDSDESRALVACRALSQACFDAGEALAELPAMTTIGLAAKASPMVEMIGSHLDTQANFSEHYGLIASILRDAARLGGGDARV